MYLHTSLLLVITILECYHLKQTLLSIEDLQDFDIANKDNQIICDIDLIIKTTRRQMLCRRCACCNLYIMKTLYAHVMSFILRKCVIGRDTHNKYFIPEITEGTQTV